MSQLRPGVLIAVIVFAIFAAYAFLAPATYRASALMVVESASPSQPAKLPQPLEAARRMSEAILDRAMLERLSVERAGSSAPEARAAAASVVRRSLEIDTSDAHAFSIGYRDTSRERAQRACNDLARHAVELAPAVLVDRSAERAGDLKRQQQTQELAAFLAAHPEAASEPPPTGTVSLDKDPALSAFHAEKANLEKRLQELQNGRSSDNPYVDPAQTDPTLLRRRLVEINSALSARRDAFAAKPPGKVLSPDLRAEWKRLLEAVTQASIDSQALASPGLVARLANPAQASGSPLDPNRPLLLFFGAVFGLGLGMAYALVARATQQRRVKSSRPPSPSLAAFTPNVQVPPAPPIPSGLGPSVPSYLPPPAASAPPIVPMPQRQISSSPPGSPGPYPSKAPAQADGERRPPSSNPPPNSPGPRRFASTLVLPPAENPTPLEDPAAAEPLLASAAQAWDEQIRAHAVPGFAVVRPGSEPPPSAGPKTSPGGFGSGPGAYSSVSKNPSPPPPAPAPQSVAPRSGRPNAMKVTQPLGSFLPDLLLKEPGAAAQLLGRDGAPHSRPPGTPRSPVPSRSQSIAPQSAPQSRYSYVSSSPPPENSVTTVRPAPGDWAPEPSLQPALRRPVCEQLYPLAVEGCLVILVVGVPDSIEQKSRAAAELALALAESGHPRILLMDGDMQSPRVHRLMRVDMPMAAGFSQQLRNRIGGSLDRRWTVVSCGKSLHVLAEGLMRSPGLLLSQQFSQGLADLRNYYDFIVVDGPSESLGIESQALDAVTDGVLFVTGKQPSPALGRLQALFGQKRIKLVVTSA